MCWENHRLDTAFWSHKLVTRLSGKTDGLIAPRDPPRNGTHTTSTRSAGSAILLKMLLCTQLAPARHVVQVGEKISTRRGCPLSRLNRRFRVEIPVSETTPPLREAAPGPAGAVADEHDARTKPAAAAAATTADRDLSRLYHATPIAIPLPLTRNKRHHHLWPATAKHQHSTGEDPAFRPMPSVSSCAETAHQDLPTC